jgi:hypothetical protein
MIESSRLTPQLRDGGLVRVPDLPMAACFDRCFCSPSWPATAPGASSLFRAFCMCKAVMRKKQNC